MAAPAACSLLNSPEDPSPGDSPTGGSTATGGTAGSSGGSGGSFAQGGSTAPAGSGGGDLGGFGGAGGSAGVALPYDCSWTLPAHKEIVNLEGLGGQGSSRRSWNRIYGAVADHDVRIFGTRSNPVPDQNIEVLTIDDDNTRVAWLPEYEVLDVERLDGDSIGVLVRFDVTELVDGSMLTYPTLRLRLIDDDDHDGSSSDLHILTDSPEAFPNFNTHWHELEAEFTGLGVGPGPGGTVGFIASYKTEDDDYHEIYGEYDGTGPTIPVVISPPSPAMTEEEVRPQSIVYVGGKVHVMAGEPEAEDGMRHLVFDRPVTDTVEARLFSPASLVEVDVAPAAGATVNLALGDLGTPIRMLIGQIGSVDFATFEATDLTVAATIPSPVNLPMGDGDPHFEGDLLVFLGPTLGDPSTLRIMLWDAHGNERGEQALPYTANLDPGVLRGEIKSTLHYAEGTLFDTLGGDMHVVWHEVRYPLGSPSEAYEVMLYDQLSCYVVEPDQ